MLTLSGSWAWLCSALPVQLAISDMSGSELLSGGQVHRSTALTAWVVGACSDGEHTKLVSLLNKSGRALHSHLLPPTDPGSVWYRREAVIANMADARAPQSRVRRRRRCASPRCRSRFLTPETFSSRHHLAANTALKNCELFV